FGSAEVGAAADRVAKCKLLNSHETMICFPRSRSGSQRRKILVVACLANVAKPPLHWDPLPHSVDKLQINARRLRPTHATTERPGSLPPAKWSHFWTSAPAHQRHPVLWLTQRAGLFWDSKFPISR